MTVRAPFWLVASSLILTGLGGCTQAANVPEASASPVAEQPAASAVSEASPASSPAQEVASAASGQDLTVLFSRVWRISQAPSEPAPGSIYIFLPNGTLLQTSCVETYALSGWTIDKDAPNVLRVTENGQLAFTAEILELTDQQLKLRQNLVLSNETRELSLTALQEEFVCPDLSR